MNAEQEKPLESRVDFPKNEPECASEYSQGPYHESERIFTRDQILSILSEAELLRELELRKSSVSRLEVISSNVPAAENLPESVLYRVAEGNKLPKEYVDKIIAMRFPSQEQQLEDVRKLGIEPSAIAIADTYLEYSINALKSNFPLDHFGISSKKLKRNRFYLDAIPDAHIEKTEKKIKKGFFGRKKIKKETKPLASFSYDHYRHIMEINIFDPCFTRACGDVLIKVNKSFPEIKCTIKHYYVVDYRQK